MRRRGLVSIALGEKQGMHRVGIETFNPADAALPENRWIRFVFLALLACR